MNKVNLNSLIHSLILIVLILTPIFSFQESISLIFGGLINNSTALTSPYIKGIKDLFFIFIILTSIIFIIKRSRINKILVCLLAIFSLFIIIPAFYYHNNIIIFLSGIRWFMPFILAIFLIGHIDEKLLRRIGKVLYWLFILHLIMQIFQLFFAGGWFGLNSLGLSARNPGLFFIPSTAGVFAILVLFFSKYYMEEKLERKIFFLIPISIFLTASGTGIAIYIIFMSLYYLKKIYIPLTPFFLVILAVVLIFLLDILSGRSGLLEESFGARLIMFRDVFYDGAYLSNNFGFGTSTGYLIANKYGLDFEMAVTDSWFATSIVNLGIINSFIVVLLMISTFIILIISKDKEKLNFFIIYTLFGATTVFTESYPANIIFAVLLAYYLRSKRVENKTTNNTQ